VTHRFDFSPDRSFDRRLLTYDEPWRGFASNNDGKKRLNLGFAELSAHLGDESLAILVHHSQP